LFQCFWPWLASAKLQHVSEIHQPYIHVNKRKEPSVGCNFMTYDNLSPAAVEFAKSQRKIGPSWPAVSHKLSKNWNCNTVLVKYLIIS
jgi:hypothetical protein